MKVVHQDLISVRAYEIWEQQGRPSGRDKEHWEQAEKELLDAAPEIDAMASAASATESQSAKDDEMHPEQEVRPSGTGRAQPRPGEPSALTKVGSAQSSI